MELRLIPENNSDLNNIILIIFSALLFILLLTGNSESKAEFNEAPQEITI